MANKIAQLRKNAKFKTASAAAKALGVSMSMIYQIEEGFKCPSVSLGVKMAKLYNCTTDEIFLSLNTTKGLNE